MSKTQNNTVMNSPKDKTQQQRTKIKNLSALLAIGLAVVTLFQAGTVKSENAALEMSIVEAQLIAEVDQWFAEEEMILEEEMFFEPEAEDKTYKVFNIEGILLAQGNPQENEALRLLVNQAEFLSEFAGEQYYTLTK